MKTQSRALAASFEQQPRMLNVLEDIGSESRRFERRICLRYRISIEPPALDERSNLRLRIHPTAVRKSSYALKFASSLSSVFAAGRFDRSSSAGGSMDMRYRTQMRRSISRF